MDWWLTKVYGPNRTRALGVLGIARIVGKPL